MAACVRGVRSEHPDIGLGQRLRHLGQEPCTRQFREQLHRVFSAHARSIRTILQNGDPRLGNPDDLSTERDLVTLLRQSKSVTNMIGSSETR